MGAGKTAKYDAATDTVTLITHGTPGTAGTYRIGSPPSLAAKLERALKAHALTDTERKILYGQSKETVRAAR